MLSSDEGSNGYGNYKTCSKRNLEAIGGFGGNLPLFSLVDLLGFATRVAYLSSSSSSNLYLNSVKKSSVILIVF